MKNNILVLLLVSVLVILSSCGNKQIVNDEIKSLNIQKDTQKDIIDIQEDIQEDIIDISQKVQEGKMTEKEAEKAMMDSIDSSETVQTQFEKSKEQMPKLLKILKFNKKCITKTDNKSDAEKCEKESIKLAKKLGIEDIYGEDEDFENKEDFEWSNEIKKETLTDIDKAISQFETMLPCVEKAETMTDMMQCGGAF